MARISISEARRLIQEEYDAAIAEARKLSMRARQLESRAELTLKAKLEAVALLADESTLSATPVTQTPAEAVGLVPSTGSFELEHADEEAGDEEVETAESNIDRIYDLILRLIVQKKKAFTREEVRRELCKADPALKQMPATAWQQAIRKLRRRQIIRVTQERASGQGHVYVFAGDSSQSQSATLAPEKAEAAVR